LIAVLTACLLSAFGAGGASARVSALGAPGDESDVALTGTEVLVTSGGNRSSASVRSIPLDGRASRRVFSSKAPSRRRVGFYDLGASADRVAFALVAVTRDVDESPRSSAVFTGPPAGPFARLATATFSPRKWFAVGTQVDGPHTLITEVRQRPSRIRHTIHSPGSAPLQLPVGGAFDVRLAGSFIAYPVPLPARNGEDRARLVIADWRTGAERFHLDDIDADGFDVAADGRAVAETRFGARDALVFGDGRSPARTLLRNDPSGTIERRRPRFAGPAIVVTTSGKEGNERVDAISTLDGRIRRLGPTSAEIGDVDTESGRVAWVANGCVLVAEASQPGTRTIPSGRCPRSEVFLESGQNATLRHRRIRTLVSCLSAEGAFCRGRVSVRLDRRGRAAGTARFKIRRGRRAAVHVKLSRRGLVAVRRRLAEEDGSGLLHIDAAAIDSRGRRSTASQGIGVALPGVKPL
jgi:hypothetical protein